MTEIPEYVLDEAREIDEDTQRLAKAVHDISLMKQDIRRLTEQLEGAQRLEADLTESLPLRARALELLCADQGWAYPTPSREQPIERKARAATQTTQANPVPAGDTLTAMYCTEECGRLLVSDGRGWVHEDDQTATCRTDLKQLVRVGKTPDGGERGE